MKRRFSYNRVAGNVLLLGFSLSISLLLGEIGLRLLDGYTLKSIRLVSTRPAPVIHDVQLVDRGREHARQVPTAAFIQPEWFELDPPPLSKGKNPDDALTDRYRSHPGHPLESIYVWNRKYLLSELCGGKLFLDGIEDAYVFDSPSGSPFPRFRFPSNKVLPSGLVTNEFGWRGPSISLNRPLKTIRIAFVGASTTVNGHAYPFSYPEHVLYWLNLWAHARNLDLRFEVVNSGHEGTNSKDFQAIVRDELLPVDPDIVVYYEGSNQFWPSDFVAWDKGLIPVNPITTFAEGFFKTRSAIGTRVFYGVASRDGREPRKRFGKVNWPASIEELDPDPMDPNLPINLPVIVSDLQAIHGTLAEAGAELVLSSFVWMAYDGMVLELPRQKMIHDYLNETFGVFPYGHIRRMADFQNRVLGNFAKRNGDSFIDVSNVYPQDSNLFDDAIHMNATGIRLHAWIALQQLVPLLEERIASGRLPRPLRDPPLTTHPAQSIPALTRIDDLKKTCAPTETAR